MVVVPFTSLAVDIAVIGSVAGRVAELVGGVADDDGQLVRAVEGGARDLAGLVAGEPVAEFVRRDRGEQVRQRRGDVVLAGRGHRRHARQGRGVGGERGDVQAAQLRALIEVLGEVPQFLGAGLLRRGQVDTAAGLGPDGLAPHRPLTGCRGVRVAGDGRDRRRALPALPVRRALIGVEQAEDAEYDGDSDRHRERGHDQADHRFAAAAQRQAHPHADHGQATAELGVVSARPSRTTISRSA